VERRSPADCNGSNKTEGKGEMTKAVVRQNSVGVGFNVNFTPESRETASLKFRRLLPRRKPAPAPSLGRSRIGMIR